jgi:hypothetical protein
MRLRAAFERQANQCFVRLRDEVVERAVGDAGLLEKRPKNESGIGGNRVVGLLVPEYPGTASAVEAEGVEEPALQPQLPV